MLYTLEVSLKKTILILAIGCLLYPLYSFSQSTGGTITGRIIDAEGKPAVNVTVRLKKLRQTVLTDNRGYFVLLRLPSLRDTLFISSIGSKLFIRIIFLNKDEAIDIGTVRLDYDIKRLQDVEINGRFANSYKSNYSFFGEKTEAPVKDIPQAISTVTKELIQRKWNSP